jgi:hypothetical protein
MRIHFWNLFLTLFFALLVIVGFAYLAGEGRIYYDISIRDLVLMALAVFRLVRLFSYDLITKFIRDSFVGAPKDSFKDTLGMLVNCPWCTGLWFSFIVVFFYFATIYSCPIILSLAAVGSLLQVLSNWIGWSAEVKKIEVQKMGG